MAILQKSTAHNRMFLMVESADHITGLTGATVTVTLSKNGGSFGAAGGSVTEVSSGWYYVALNTTDTGTAGDLAYHCTAASGDPTDFADQVVDPTVATLGVNVVNVNAVSAGSVTTVNAVQGTTIGIAVDSLGNVSTTANIKKNTATAGFMLVMTNSTTHAPMTGLTVASTRAIDGGAFSSTTNSVSEVANGSYTINLSAADVNGNHIMLRFTATGADDLNIEIITQP